MNKYINKLPLLALLFLFLGSCKKTEYSLGQLKAPTGLNLSAALQGVDANNPNGDGTGYVDINITAQDAITYKIDFGDGITKMVPSGSIKYKYSLPGVNTYTITVNAIGTGGIISTTSTTIQLYVKFEIPANIIDDLTGGTSKVWICDHDAPGHVGVGPADAFSPIWYAAAPNTRDACLYDDEITFSTDGNGNINMSVDNKGETYIIGAAASFYGLSSAESCVMIDASGDKRLIFSDANSGSTPAVSTMIQFYVPGNGIINFATGANTYEILSIDATHLFLRNIGADGNSWYQKLIVK